MCTIFYLVKLDRYPGSNTETEDFLFFVSERDCVQPGELCGKRLASKNCSRGVPAGRKSRR
jgi:hypothetical protein